MKKITKKESNHLTKKLEKQFVARILQESGFPAGKKAYVKDRDGKLIIRFKKTDYEY